ncbi:MAG: UDP-N-acetylmuramoyl-L-alanine--D-glutamate ligase [Clostridiales bacterium]|jgi:UDP-N-acetylmuramoylalanine--D-glutamate ligase|nr:UDP-N-acetylmuramoyl-L-alanine--D-glutamate ligase [Clostridiales bacterium]
MDVKNKKILVCGIARSGVAAAKLLNRRGALVTLQDSKPEEKLDVSLSGLETDGAKLFLGRNPDDIVTDFDMIVISPGIPLELPFVQKAKAAGVPIIGEIELAYAYCSCPITAVTGTNGKTTTTALIGDIMRAYKPKTAVVGNIGEPFAEHAGALGKDDWAVAEISSFQLETIAAFRPKISLVLNITPDHLDRHKTMERYIELKESIGKNQTKEDFMILNADDPYCLKLRTEARRVFFSLRRELDEGFYLNGRQIHVKFNNLDIDLLDADEMNIFGNHNVENALASAAAGICAGAPAETVKQAILNFKAVEHRIEFTRELNGVRFYNDSKATNTDAAIKAITAMREPIVLIGGGYDKRADFSDWIKAFDGRVKHLVLLGEVADKIADTCRAFNFTAFERVNSLKDAVDAAYGKAEKGDCVLLSPACASWDMFDNYEQRGWLFKEFVNML